MKVELYEDNAGGLLMGHGRVWYNMTPVQDGFFGDDAAAFDAGDTADWTVDRYDQDESWGDLIAVWDDGNITIPGNPGTAAKNYLGIPE